jgi:ATP-dependent RNA helicase RhlE
MSFSSFELHADLVKAVKKKGFEQPTPIQRLAIPPLLQGRDIMATAVTGSGKTAAFLLPILQQLMEQPKGKTRVLVLVPTRELAVQICEHWEDLARYTALKAAAVYGGVSPAPQAKAFRDRVAAIIATPGRLLDLQRQNIARLNDIRYLVLDEADRMLDMGFLPDIRRILESLPVERQTLFFSATLPPPIVALARDMLKKPVSLNITPQPLAAAGITHVAYPIPQELKSNLLLALLEQNKAKSILTFTRTKHRANRLADFLERNGIRCGRIHGNRSQNQRTAALDGFKGGRFRVLVATDIAARGIDVEALGLVCNFDVPQQAEDYVHRVGRTGRANAAGDACTLVAPDEEGRLRSIEQTLGRRMPREKVAGFDYDKQLRSAPETFAPERRQPRAHRSPAYAPRETGMAEALAKRKMNVSKRFFGAGRAR